MIRLDLLFEKHINANVTTWMNKIREYYELDMDDVQIEMHPSDSMIFHSLQRLRQILAERISPTVKCVILVTHLKEVNGDLLLLISDIITERQKVYLYIIHDNLDETALDFLSKLNRTEVIAINWDDPEAPQILLNKLTGNIDLMIEDGRNFLWKKQREVVDEADDSGIMAMPSYDKKDSSIAKSDQEIMRNRLVENRESLVAPEDESSDMSPALNTSDETNTVDHALHNEMSVIEENQNQEDDLVLDNQDDTMFEQSEEQEDVSDQKSRGIKRFDAGYADESSSEDVASYTHEQHHSPMPRSTAKPFQIQSHSPRRPAAFNDTSASPFSADSPNDRPSLQDNIPQHDRTEPTLPDDKRSLGEKILDNKQPQSRQSRHHSYRTATATNPQLKDAVFSYVPQPENDPYPYPENYTTVQHGAELGPRNTWVMAGASRRGLSHWHKGSFRDDAFGLAHVGAWNIVVVADGAGSAKFSRVTANRSVDSIIDVISDHARKIPTDPTESEHSIKKALVDAIHEAHAVQTRFTQDENLKKRDTYTTLLILIHQPFADGSCVFGTFQVGDGFIMGMSDRSASQIAKADHGSDSGTRFVLSFTPEELESRIVTHYSSNQIHTFLLTTDGIEEDLKPSASEYSEGIRLADKYQKYTEALLNEYLFWPNTEAWGEILLHVISYERASSFDDRTLCVITLQPEPNPYWRNGQLLG